MVALRSRARLFVLAAVLGVASGGGCVIVTEAAVMPWVGPCEYWGNSIWQWMWNCPDVPPGGGGSGAG